MKTKVLLSAMIGIAISFSAFTQEVPQAQKNMAQFVGKWSSSDIQLTLGDKTYGGEYTLECVAVNNNTGILAHEKFVSPELGTMLGENLLGFDPNLQQMHLYSIDNMGTAHDHYGYWIDDHHLFVQYQGTVEGKVCLEQIDMVFHSDGKMSLKLTAMLNGESFKLVKGSFVKK